ncbi:MAG: universal stress protein [Paracoccaceae bacterium]
MALQVLVPLHTYPDGNSTAVASHVAGLARHLGAEVHALVLNATIPPASSLTGTQLIDVSGMAREVMSRCRARGDALAAALAEALRAQGLGFRATELDCVMGTIGRAEVASSHYCDVILVALGADDASMRANAETLIFGSGRPTLVVAEDAPPSSFGHVAIAWDGSRVATRAVADAHEFLRRAARVTIVSVTDEKVLPEASPGSRLAEHLARHGIEAAVSQVRGEGRAIATVLQDQARGIGADLMVMGAFGHSRLRDFVMGGATNGVLHDLKLPVLLSH